MGDDKSCSSSCNSPDLAVGWISVETRESIVI